MRACERAICFSESARVLSPLFKITAVNNYINAFTFFSVADDVTDRKLQLADLEWNYFLDEEKFDDNFAAVVRKMRPYLDVSDDNVAPIHGTCTQRAICLKDKKGYGFVSYT